MTSRNKLSVDMGVSVLSFIGMVFFALHMDAFVDVGVPSTVSPATFPFYIAVVFCFFLFFYTFASVMSYIRFGHSERDLQAPQNIQKDHILSCGLYFIILFAYYFLFQYAGFLVSTPLIMIGVSSLIGNKNFKILLPCFILFTVALYYVTLHLLKIQLPLGLFWEL